MGNASNQLMKNKDILTDKSFIKSLQNVQLHIKIVFSEVKDLETVLFINLPSDKIYSNYLSKLHKSGKMSEVQKQFYT